MQYDYIHVPSALGPWKDVVQLGGIQGQRAPAIPADASTLLEGTVMLVRPPLPLKPEKKRRER